MSRDGLEPEREVSSLCFFDEPEAHIVATAVLAAAAGQAGGAAAHRPNAGHLQAAGRAAVAVFARELAALQREIVAALFIRQAEIGAGLPPFRAVRLDATA